MKSFNEKYLGNLAKDIKPHSQASAEKFLLPLLDELHDANLLDHIDDHLDSSQSSNPLEKAEAYIVEAVEAAWSPLNPSINKNQVIPNAKPFKKSLKLSALRKVLRSNPEYFK